MAFRRTVEGIVRGRLQELAALGLERGRPEAASSLDGPWIERGGRHCLSFLSNDYLGLSQNARWKSIVTRSFAGGRPSSSASRLAGGWSDASMQAEKAFADYFGFSECLFFPSGYQGSLALISVLARRGQPVLCDRRVHACLAHALASSGADIRPYAHSDLAHLERRLQSLDKDWQPIVLTESLFSMDGDVTDAAALADLERRYGFFLVVDEAHALGCLGDGGRGVFAGVTPAPDAVLGTLGKALGFFGAFALLPAGFGRALENLSSPVMHSTAVPPAHAAACVGLAGLLPELDEERRVLAANAETLREELRARNIHAAGEAHIVSVPVGDEKRAGALAKALAEENVLVLAARAPTVPSGQALLRFSVTALHDRAMLAKAASCLARVWN